jgi:hypothetical protein
VKVVIGPRTERAFFPIFRTLLFFIFAGGPLLYRLGH